ncbi:GNAT family N-acetyltransferase [Sutcliffiella halmapala]|uniref:GNAT family N-acetyltransferase n=1 Tax=Sutcliffiella halmapala TaxID=79882 RepID=UPI001F22C0C0|nr:GNAT family N-acetyltransferase [Sutcliffiella halmapala]
MNYSIGVSLEKNDKFSTYLNEQIKEFNNVHSNHHKAIRKKDSVQPINIMVSDENNQWIGGLTAEVYWNWIEINYFWFKEEYRGNGLGGTLLDKAEKEAMDKGANKALLTTFEFQARAFYEKKGYEVVGEIKDYPPGSSYFTMVKKLM